MNHFSKSKSIIMLIVFCISIFLVFFGRAKVGYLGLALEVIGIVGLLIELYIYNKQYK